MLGAALQSGLVAVSLALLPVAAGAGAVSRVDDTPPEGARPALTGLTRAPDGTVAGALESAAGIALSISTDGGQSWVTRAIGVTGSEPHVVASGGGVLDLLTGGAADRAHRR